VTGHASVDDVDAQSPDRRQAVPHRTAAQLRIAVESGRAVGEPEHR
jgi:hypothetical protein